MCSGLGNSLAVCVVAAAVDGDDGVGRNTAANVGSSTRLNQQTPPVELTSWA